MYTARTERNINDTVTHTTVCADQTDKRGNGVENDTRLPRDLIRYF